MTQDEIIRMAREAGLTVGDNLSGVTLVCVTNGTKVPMHITLEELERFAALVAEPWIETNKALAKEIIELQKQAEQRSDSERMEPVGWARTSESGEVLDCISHTYKITQHCTVDYDEPFYTAPVRTKDLTDDEILPDGYGVVTTYDGLLEFARAVIAADREKNK